MNRKETTTLYNLRNTVPVSILSYSFKCFKEVNERWELWCFTTTNDLYRWLGLLSFILLWVSDIRWRTHFCFLMKALQNSPFFQLLFMMGIFCTSVQLAGTKALHLNHIFLVNLSHTMLNGRLAENPMSNYNNRIIIIIAVPCTYVVSVRLKWDSA